MKPFDDYKATNPSSLILLAQWIHIQGKDAEGWIGLKRNGYKMVYSESGYKFLYLENDQDSSSMGCAYLKGKKGKWSEGSCGEVRGFICEFEGTL